MDAYDAVFFDLDGTLWNNLDCSNYILKVVMPDIMARVNEKDSNNVVNAFNAVFLEMLQEYGIYSNRVRSRVERFERLFKYYGVDDGPLAQELANKYAAARKLYMRNFLKGDTLQVLQDLLDRDLKLGVITNGVGIIQRQTLEGLGLHEFFEHVVISGLLGYQKPDRRIFEYALKRAQCSPERVLYVGDNPSVDVAGANRVGIRSVWLFSHRQVLTKDMVMPDFVISQLSDILSIVDSPAPVDPEVELA